MPPSSDSSPSKSTSSTLRRVTTPLAARTPMAMGRSNDEPALRMSAGARFTVTRCSGNSNPEFRMALRTRSRLSRTDVSGSPTIVIPGRPNETSTSTLTVQASIPYTAAVRTHASIDSYDARARTHGFTQDPRRESTEDLGFCDAETLARLPNEKHGYGTRSALLQQRVTAGGREAKAS